MPSPTMPAWSIEDPDTQEKDAFLAQSKKFTVRRRFKMINVLLSLLSILALCTFLIYFFEPHYMSNMSTPTNKIIETNITRDPTRSVVKKVTGLYGSGSWVDTTKESTSSTHQRYLKSIALHKKHAEMHGHEQIISHKQLFGKVVDNAYTKIGNLMEQNFIEMNKQSEQAAKWLFWHDVDTVVLNNQVSLDTFIRDIHEKDNVQFIYTEDQNGLNAGVFYVRVGEWASVFLSTVLAMSKAKDHPKLDFWEQTAIAKTVAENEFFGSASVMVPRDWFNSYAWLSKDETTGRYASAVHPGTFLVHMVGPSKHQPGWYDYYLNLGEGSDPAYHSTDIAEVLESVAEDFWRKRAEHFEAPHN